MSTEPIVLLIEDDSDWREIIKRKLRRFSCVVDVAENVNQVDYIFIKEKSPRYSLIILDLILDKYTGISAGIDVLRSINAVYTDVPVIIVTAYEDYDELIQVLHPFSHLVANRIFLKVNFNGFLFDKLIQELLNIDTSNSAPEQKWRRIYEGVMYAFCFLKLDIQDHSKLIKEHNSKDVEETLDAFEVLVEEKVEAKSGQIWSWLGDGGLCVFNMPDGVQDAVLCAIEILGNLTEFNANRDKNKIGEVIKIRTAVHCGNAKYRHEKGRIHSEAINFVSHLEAKKAKTNGVCISSDALKESTPLIRSKFKKDAKKFEGKEIFHLIKQ